MAEFAYNNAKNASSSYTHFKLNRDYHPWMLYKDNVDPWSKSKSAEELLTKLRGLMIVCRKNLNHTQELQKQAHDKATKMRSSASGNKV